MGRGMGIGGRPVEGMGMGEWEITEEFAVDLGPLQRMNSICRRFAFVASQINNLERG